MKSAKDNTIKKTYNYLSHIIKTSSIVVVKKVINDIINSPIIPIQLNSEMGIEYNSNLHFDKNKKLDI